MCFCQRFIELGHVWSRLVNRYLLEIHFISFLLAGSKRQNELQQDYCRIFWVTLITWSTTQRPWFSHRKEIKCTFGWEWLRRLLIKISKSRILKGHQQVWTTSSHLQVICTFAKELHCSYKTLSSGEPSCLHIVLIFNFLDSSSPKGTREFLQSVKIDKVYTGKANEPYFHWQKRLLV